MTFQIFKHHIVLYDEEGEIRAVVSTKSMLEMPEMFNSVLGKTIRDLVKEAHNSAQQDTKEFNTPPEMTDYTYIYKCLSCDKIDPLVMGFCKPCFDYLGLKYEWQLVRGEY